MTAQRRSVPGVVQLCVQSQEVRCLQGRLRGGIACVGQAQGRVVFQGKAVVANSAGTEAGSAGGVFVGVATGLIQVSDLVDRWDA
jgi:hypothetical protein